MVNDAEKYRKEDEEAAARTTAKNGLESYAYNLRNALQDEKVSDKLDADDIQAPNRYRRGHPKVGYAARGVQGSDHGDRQAQLPY